jgi:hypothetical protein
MKNSNKTCIQILRSIFNWISKDFVFNGQEAYE